MLHASSQISLKLPLFEGPLDLLLHLVRQNRVEITDIPIALITDQYLQYLRLMEQMNLEIASEFLIMASTLIEIKSRTLLPKPPKPQEEEEAEDPRAELAARLEEYSRYKAAVETLKAWEQDRLQWYFRNPENASAEYELPLDEGELSADWLAKALDKLLSDAIEADEPPSVIVPKKRISLRIRMVEVWRKVSSTGRGKKVRFRELLEEKFTRWDVVLTFLCMLELLKQGRLRVEQETPFGEIELMVKEEEAA